MHITEEGLEIRAKFDAELKQRQAATFGTQKSAIELLMKMPPISSDSKRFHDLVNAYSSRSDLRIHYSSRQITALAAAVLMHRSTDMPPDKFHAIFAGMCIIAETKTPPKLNHPGKKMVTFSGIALSRFL